MQRIIGLAIVGTLITGAAAAQFWDQLTAPRVSVTITHPPLLHIKLTRVAVTAGSGPCVDDLTNGIIDDLSQSRVDVLDRQHMQDIFAESSLTAQGAADPATAARLGKLTGAAAMLYVNVTTCRAGHHYSSERPLFGRGLIYVSQTTFELKGTLRLTDLTTGRIIKNPPIQVLAHQESRSTEGRPDPPADEDVQSAAIEQARENVHRLVLPWTEATKVYFFNDVECGIRSAFDSLKAGDNESAFEKTKQAVATCASATNVKPKTIGHAYYNQGIAYFMQSDYDQALANLEKASQYMPGQIVSESIADCQRAKQLAAETARVEASTPIGDVPASSPATIPQRPASDSANTGRTLAKSSVGSESDAKSAEERLKHLKDLYSKGLISKEEYEKKKAEILKSM